MAIQVGHDEGDPMVEPNVIPLVDIMLVLLIIMIITVPVMTQAVKLDLPKEVNRPTDTKPENINLSIDFDGSIYWRSEEHTSELQSQSNLVCRLLLEKKKK